MLTLLQAKGAAAVLLSGGSLFAGLLPNWIGLVERIEHSLFLSIILCFGAGVLLSTSVLHILQDTVSALPKWGELAFCVGFMALYLVDEIVQFFCLVTADSENSQPVHHHSSEPSEEDRLLGGKGHHSKYGSIKKHPSPERKSKVVGMSSTESNSQQQYEESSELLREEKLEHGAKQDSKCSDSPQSSQTSTNPVVRDKNKSVKKMGLVTALCIHSILEGLAVGTQPSSSKVIVLLLAVSCHKLVITFCLGAELVSDGSSFGALIGLLSIYSLSSGAGVLIGIVMNSTNTAVVPLLQGLAGGSLLYITVGEILPRERFHKSHCDMPKTTGLIQFLSVLTGIIPIAAMNMYLDNGNS